MKTPFFRLNLVGVAVLALGLLRFTPQCSAATFTDAGGSGGTIPDGPSGAAVHRTVVASGLAGSITVVSVTLTGFTHTFPDDLGFLLVGPDGTHNHEFWSDAGGFGPGVSGITVTVADSGATLIPDNTTPVNNTTYRPADYLDAEPNNFFGPTFTISHPTGGNVPGTATFASVFNGLAGNGNWDLYVRDEGAGDVGSFATWSVNITTSGGNQAPVIANLNLDTANFTEGGIAVHLDIGTAAAVRARSPTTRPCCIEP